MSKLFKRDGVWYAWVRDAKGKTVKRTTGCTTREAAERTVPRLELEAADPAYAAANRVTTQEVLDDYYRSRERLGRAEGTLHHVRIKAGALLGLLPSVAAEITHVKLLAYVDKRLSEGARRTTAKKELRVLKASLRLARRNGKWYGDPDAVIPELEDDYEPRKRALTPWELIALVAELDRGGTIGQARAGHVAFIVATSARWQESLAFAVADVSRDAFRSYVRLWGTKTKGSRRTVAIIGAAQSMLEWVLSRPCWMPRYGCRFLPWGNVRRDLAAACRRAGIEPVTPNDLRRTFATWLREAGAEPSTIGAAMGHVDSRMVERVYGRLQPEALGRLLEQQTSRLPPGEWLPVVERRSRTDATAGETAPCPCDWSIGENCPECYPGPANAGRYASCDSPETAPLYANGATWVTIESPGIPLDSPCAGTESNCRHGDFQSGPRIEGVWPEKLVQFASSVELVLDVWSIHGSFFAWPVAP